MRQVIVLSATLGLALLGSYLTWTDTTEEVDDKTVVVVRGEVDALKKIVWDGEDTITLSTRSDDKGDYLWVELIDRTKTPVAPPQPPADEAEEPDQEEPLPAVDEDEVEDDEVEDEVEAEPEYEVTEKRIEFLGNTQAQQTWEAFAPLNALRELAGSSDADPDVFEFDAPEATITIEGASTAEVVLGGESFGSKNRYARHDGKVYLLGDAIIRPLQFASSRLVERTLQPLARDEIVSVDVHLPDGTTHQFAQHKADVPAEAFWARVDTPDVSDLDAATWLDKAFSLRLRGYVHADEVTEELTEAVRYVVHGTEGAWTVEILRAAGEEPVWYARSDFNRSLLSLTASLAQNFVDDLDALAAP